MQRVGMNKAVYRNFLFLMVFSFLLLLTNSPADSPADAVESPPVYSQGKKVDPHGQEGMCNYCHINTEVEEGKANFRLDTVEAVCIECHYELGSSLEDYLQRMLPDIPVKEGLITYFVKQPDFSCPTCHFQMCQGNSRMELRRRNPHIQLDYRKNPIEKKCLFCHAAMPDYSHPEYEKVVMRYDISYVCSLCHFMMSAPKGKTMTEAMVAKKEKSEKIFYIFMPLGPNNKVVCASCHNPHQPGVPLGKGKYAAARGEKNRLRLESCKQLCVACHVGNY
jgi:hypothetical protein